MNQVRLSVIVIPSSSRDRIVGWHGNALKVKVQAPPEKGKANRAVIAHLAEWLGLPKHAVCPKSGQSSGNKIVVIHGFTAAEINQRIDAISV